MIENEYLSRVNPTYNTAQQTLYMLAASGNTDALDYIMNMKIENGMQKDIDNNNSFDELSDDDIERLTTGMSLGVECRYEMVTKLLKESDVKSVFDIACGYTPRALSSYRSGYDYVGLDLPIVVDKMNKVAKKSKIKLKHDVYVSGDATNPSSLIEAADMLDGEVFITSEGLLQYLSENELEQMIEGIKAILQKHGGAWYSSDMEVYYDEMAAAMTDNKDAIKIFNKGRQAIGNDTTIFFNATNFTSIVDKFSFFENRGLNIERLPFYSEDINLKLLEIYPEKKDIQKKLLAKCSIWKMTLKDDSVDNQTINISQEGITISAKRNEDTLEVKLGGRMDTISSPILLMVFEEENDEKALKQLVIDAEELEYISSAGLRTLLIGIKTMGSNSVRVINASKEIKYIFESTGFGSIITVE